MRHSHAVYALLRLHAELSGEIIKHRDKQRRLRLNRDKVCDVIRMLEPGINIRTEAIIRRKPNPWFKHGELFRASIELLKAAGRPLTGMEIATTLLRQRGITPPDAESVFALRRSIERSLSYHRGHSIEAVGANAIHWKLAD